MGIDHCAFKSVVSRNSPHHRRPSESSTTGGNDVEEIAGVVHSALAVCTKDHRRQVSRYGKDLVARDHALTSGPGHSDLVDLLDK